MAILDFTTTPEQSSNTNGRGNNGGRNMPFGNMTQVQQPKATVWVNIGVPKNGKFIQLPIGLPIDTMSKSEIRGQNEDFVKQRTAQNDLLEYLQKLGASLQPGEERDLNLQVRIRRINQELTVDKESNEYSINFDELLVAAE